MIKVVPFQLDALARGIGMTVQEYESLKDTLLQEQNIIEGMLYTSVAKPFFSYKIIDEHWNLLAKMERLTENLHAQKRDLTNYLEEIKKADEAPVNSCSMEEVRASKSEEPKPSGWATGLSVGLDFIPIIGNVKGGIEAAFGRDFITGSKLASWERGVSTAAIIGGPLVKGGKHAVKGAGAINKAAQAGKQATHVPGTPTKPNYIDYVKGEKGERPANFSPPGAGRNGAFREAKRASGIPVSEQPISVRPAVDKRGNPIPGRDYFYKDGKVIRDHAGGHRYPDDPAQNRGSHINDVHKNHYDYPRKNKKGNEDEK